MERLTDKEKLNYFCSYRVGENCCFDCDDCYIFKLFGRLSELEDKLESGQLVEIPKFGDTYWYIYSGGVPEAVIVTRIEVEINQSETRIYAYGRACGGLIGQIMFPTYEQAEARLKELQEKGK